LWLTDHVSTHKSGSARVAGLCKKSLGVCRFHNAAIEQESHTRGEAVSLKDVVSDEHDGCALLSV
jgi:hypothetical protein